MYQLKKMNVIIFAMSERGGGRLLFLESRVMLNEDGQSTGEKTEVRCLIK